MKDKVKVFPKIPKDRKVAKQMQNILNWQIVQSKSDHHPEFGYSMGQVLCRNEREDIEVIEKSEFKDCYTKDYND